MKWISVEDKLPNENEWIILGSRKCEMVCFGIRMDNIFVNPDLNYLRIEFVTHWMPLPNPP